MVKLLKIYQTLLTFLQTNYNDFQKPLRTRGAFLCTPALWHNSFSL